jgi:uncharacterized protein YecA (UPF0149 family)
MSERFEKNRKKKQLDDLGLRHRSTEEVEAEDDAVRKAKEQRDKNPGKYQLKHRQEVGRNDPCPCGSGKKYKKCCGAEK